MYNSGYTDKEIADKLGCTRHNITSRLNKLGITNRKSKIDNLQLRNQISNSLKGRYLGKDNPNYKGNQNLRQIARGLFKTMSKELLRNQNYTCSICGKYGGELNVHHIKPFNVILDEFINNVYDGRLDTFSEQILKYDDFTNKNNLIVVCKRCHYNIHYTDNCELSPYRWKSATTIEHNLIKKDY